MAICWIGSAKARWVVTSATRVPSKYTARPSRRLSTNAFPLLMSSRTILRRLEYTQASGRRLFGEDLATYGKAMSCGYPLAAVAGGRALMATADPARKGSLEYACLSGTLSGNPIACAAGVAALGELSKPGVYDRLHALGRRLRSGMSAVAAARGVPLRAIGAGPIAQPIFVDPTRPIHADRDLASADGARATRLGHELIRRGIFVIPGAKMYISLAHSDADIDQTLAAFEDALLAVARPT